MHPIILPNASFFPWKPHFVCFGNPVCFFIRTILRRWSLYFLAAWSVDEYTVPLIFGLVFEDQSFRLTPHFWVFFIVFITSFLAKQPDFSAGFSASWRPHAMENISGMLDDWLANFQESPIFSGNIGGFRFRFFHWNWGIPSGKHTKSYGTSSSLIGKWTINGGFHKWRYRKMDGLWGKLLLKPIDGNPQNGKMIHWSEGNPSLSSINGSFSILILLNHQMMALFDSPMTTIYFLIPRKNMKNFLGQKRSPKPIHIAGMMLGIPLAKVVPQFGIAKLVNISPMKLYMVFVGDIYI